MNLLQKLHTGWQIEVMEKIRQKHEVVIVPVIEIKRTAFKSAQAIADPHPRGVLARDLQYRCPISATIFARGLGFANAIPQIP